MSRTPHIDTRQHYAQLQLADKPHYQLGDFSPPGGTVFNEMVLKEGHACANLSFDHFHKRFQLIQKCSREAGVGPWANATLPQMPGVETSL